MYPLEVMNNIFWVGALDPQLRIFDIIMKAEHGTTYNSYLIKGKEKTALIDTVKKNFQDDFIYNLSTVTDIKKIDYIIINHTESDHSGALELLLSHAENAKVVISKSAELFLKNILNRDVNPIKVGDNDVIELGEIEMRFISAPFLHWPDTMFTYIPQNRILFPCDFLSSHFCDDRLFNDKVIDFSYSFKYYFNHIMRPFKEFVLKAISKIENLDIDIIAPSHGPILRKDVKKYIELYREWAQPGEKKKNTKRLIVFYISAYGNTEKMAEAISKGAEEQGVNVSLFDIQSTEIYDVINLVEEADGIAVGSPTINGDAVKPVWDLLSSLATIKLKGKVGATFGSYGWSGEGPSLIEERLKSLKIKVPYPAFKVILIPTDNDLVKCREFGKSIAKEL